MSRSISVSRPVRQPDSRLSRRHPSHQYRTDSDWGDRASSIEFGARATERYEVAPATIEDDEWQERALCAQTDPEAFFPEKGGSTREAKRICLGCEVVTPAWTTHWPTTSASASGAGFPSGSAVASSAASSESRSLHRASLVVDRRVDDRRFDAQIGGHLSHQDFMQQLGEFDGVLRPSLDRLAEQHNSRPRRITSDIDARRDQPGQRDRAIGDHLRRPLHGLGILRRDPGYLVDGDIQRRTPDPANVVRSVRRPRAPPCRTARPGCASPARSAEAAGRAFPGRGVIREDLATRPRGKIVTVGDRRVPRLRVSGGSRRFPHDSLSFVNVPRRCCRPGCPHYAVATLTFVYSDSTAVVGPAGHGVRAAFVGSVRGPRRPDHRAARVGAGSPRRAAAVPPGRRRSGRAGRRGTRGARRRAADQRGGRRVFRSGHRCARWCADGAAGPRPESNGRRRGHLRVLPDPSD